MHHGRREGRKIEDGRPVVHFEEHLSSDIIWSESAEVGVLDIRRGDVRMGTPN
jgi:hypothetical protein